MATELLDRVPLAGHTVIADKNLARAEFEALMAAAGATVLRPDRKEEAPRYGSPRGGAPVDRVGLLWTCKGQLGLAVRIALRLLALASGIWHNQLIGQPGPALAIYGR